MASRIRQCLLDDPERGEVDTARQPGELPFLRETDRCPGRLCLLDQVVELAEPGLRRPVGLPVSVLSEDSEQATGLGERLPGGGGDRLEAIAGVLGELGRGQSCSLALDATEEAMAESTRAQTVMEERARIARELHDIVAHHLSVIALDSEVVRRTSPELPSDAGHRLEVIASTAREALTETRRLLGVLREDTGGVADRTPQPGLDELDDLIDRARATGAHVRLTREGETARLPLSVDLAAYRIVQEALTNARRHAPGADVDIEVGYRDRALHLRVRDHGPGAGDGLPLAGHGLMGMRERATLAGGTFSSGPADGGGFEVDVTLPITEPAP